MCLPLPLLLLPQVYDRASYDAVARGTSCKFPCSSPSQSRGRSSRTLMQSFDSCWYILTRLRRYQRSITSKLPSGHALGFTLSPSTRRYDICCPGQRISLSIPRRHSTGGHAAVVVVQLRCRSPDSANTVAETPIQEHRHGMDRFANTESQARLRRKNDIQPSHANRKWKS